MSFIFVHVYSCNLTTARRFQPCLIQNAQRRHVHCQSQMTFREPQHTEKLKTEEVYCVGKPKYLCWPWIIWNKASELVPSSLFPRWNSMWIFARGALYDSSSLAEVRFATLYQQSSSTSWILKLVCYYVVIGSQCVLARWNFQKSWLWTLLCRQKIHHLFFSHTWGARFKYLPEGCPYMLMYSALHIMQWSLRF